MAPGNMHGRARGIRYEGLLDKAASVKACSTLSERENWTLERQSDSPWVHAVNR